MKNKKDISTAFLFLLLGVSFYFAYLVFKPFIPVIILSAVFVTLLYPVYDWLLRKLKGRATLAAMLSVLAFVLIIVLPIGNFLVLLAKESADTYALMEQKIMAGDLDRAIDRLFSEVLAFQRNYLSFVDFDTINVSQIFLDLGNRLNTFIVNGAAVLIKGTTQLITSLFFLLLTMFYLFKDGKPFLEKLSFLTPISNRYDRKLFDRFQQISKSTILGSLITGIAQGLIAGIGYMIVGAPALFLGVATGMAALIPVVGTALVWVPTVIVLVLVGSYYKALFLLIYGVVVVGVTDNVVRTLVVQGKANIHPLFVFFSIFGGVAAFGFLGIIFGPLALAILLTMIHIYELEYHQMLER